MVCVAVPGERWEIESLDACSVEVERFKGKRYAASVGCNRILGTYQLTGESLKFLPGPMTKMACPDPLG
jgi:heat shock protein HslJ